MAKSSPAQGRVIDSANPFDEAKGMGLEDMTELPFPDILGGYYTDFPAKRKGARTTQSIIWAAAHMLNTQPFHDIKVADICTAAAVSNAAFYQYFADKTEVFIGVLKLFADCLFNGRVRRAASEEDDRAVLYQTNLDWIKITRHNKGLIRALLQASLIHPQISEHYVRLNNQYVKRTARSLARRAGRDIDRVLLLVVALNAMTDEYTRRLLDPSDELFSNKMRQAANADAEQAEILTDIWYRIIYDN